MTHDAIAPEPAAVEDVVGREHGFHHETLFYSGEDGFLHGTVPFIEDGLSLGEPVLVAVGQERITLLKEALRGGASRVGFTDMHLLGHNPARIIPAWRGFLEENGPDGRSVRGIGEPIWRGRSGAELSECQRHESLLNVAFGDGQAWRLLCPYDVLALDEDVIAAARRSHPFVAEDATSTSAASDAYVSVEHGWSPFEGSLPAPASRPEELEFTSGDLGVVRRLVAAIATDLQLPADRVEDVVLAVNELASNSIQHGGGHGVVRVWAEADTLLCEVIDGGHFDEALVGRISPTADQCSGRGLWMANVLCDLVRIRSTRAGSVVRLHTRLA